MPIITPNKKQGINVFNGQNAGQPRGIRNSFLFNTDGHGVPRGEDLATIRLLEQTHPVELPINTVQTQLTTTDWSIRPRTENPSTAAVNAADDAEAWLEGSFNANNETFDHFMKQWARDLLAVDAGVVELVPDGNGVLREMYARDGTLFTKSPDMHGRLPSPDSGEAAYWQFGSNLTARLDRNSAIQDMLDDRSLRMSFTSNQKPQPFFVDQIVWAEENPRTNRVYGTGRVQQVQKVAEILLNQDATNLEHFTGNEIPEGILSLPESSQQEMQRFREYWKEQIEGQERKLPVVQDNVDWIPFRPPLDDLQFLESQQWYHSVIWSVFGLSKSEVGQTDDVNRASAQVDQITVWRKNTKPLLTLFANEINRNILPHTEPAMRSPVELEFVWEMEHPAVQEMERERQIEDLSQGVRTVNEVRRERGEEEIPWGDLPAELQKSVARRFPKWALREWSEIDEDALPEGDGNEPVPEEQEEDITEAVDNGLTDRQAEVLDEHGEEDESFKEMLTRFDYEHSRKQAARELGISSRSFYSWLKDYDLY